MFDEIALPGFLHIAKELMPGKTLADILRWRISIFPRAWIPIASNRHARHRPRQPSAFGDGGKYVGEDFGFELKPGRVSMLEPNPITMDGGWGCSLDIPSLLPRTVKNG